MVLTPLKPGLLGDCQHTEHLCSESWCTCTGGAAVEYALKLPSLDMSSNESVVAHRLLWDAKSA